MKGRVVWALVLALTLAALVPAGKRAYLRTVEFRAVRAFDRGDFAAALPLYETLERAASPRDERIEDIRGQIQYCREQIAPMMPPGDGAVTTSQPSGQRVAHAPPKRGEVRRMTIKELGNFEFDDRAPTIPADVTALTGLHLQTSGFMIPLDGAARVTRFILVPSLLDCCYGQPPQVQHTIVVETAGGEAVEYTADEVVVDGTLSAAPKVEDGRVTEIFHLTGAHVRAGKVATKGSR